MTINRKGLRLFTLIGFATMMAAPRAEEWNLKDIDGGQDHPLIKRFNGSWLIGYHQIGFDVAKFPSQLGLEGMNELIKPLKVEGKITRLLYIAPHGKRPYEVQRNYTTALKAVGYKETISCSGEKECKSTSYGLDDGTGELKIIDIRRVSAANAFAKAKLDGVDNGGNIFGEHDDLQQMSVGTLSANGKMAHVLISSDKHYAADITITYIQIVQPEDMQLGQVAVDLNGLQSKDKIASEISAQGKIAIYGVYFDTAKADIKPESKAQIAEMAKYLQENRDKKVFIVGHTDNQGNFAANSKLSLDRAKAVVAYLVKEYNIDGARLAAQGVANLAPLSNNQSDAGRSKNRRVEMVEQ